MVRPLATGFLLPTGALSLNSADSDSESQHEARARDLPGVGGKLVLPLALLELSTSAQGSGLVGFTSPRNSSPCSREQG